MFTIIAGIAVAALAWWSQRWANNERAQQPSIFDDDQVRQSVMFVRDDLRTIALLLAAILLMLGIIADRL